MSGAAAMFLRASKFFHPLPFKHPDGHAFTLSKAKLQFFSSAPSIGVANSEQNAAIAAGQEKVEVVNAVGQDKSAPTLHSADAPPVLNVVIPVIAVLPKAEASKAEAEPPKAERPSAVQSLGKEPPVAASSAGEPAPERPLGRRRRYGSKYRYGSIRLEPNEDLLKQPKGAETMKKLGLEAFLNAKIPKVNPELCDEFLSTYKESGGQGVVQGRDIVISPEAIHKLTGLPLGVKHVGRLSRQESVALKSFATWRHADMYCLQSLRLGDESEAVSAAGRLLMQKMRMRRHGSGTVAAQILLRLQESLQSNAVQPQWAAYMADHMRRAARLTHTKDRLFYFGGWLSGLIQNALPEDQVKKLAAAAAEKNGEEELKKKKPVRSRAKGVKKEKGEEKAKKTAVVIEV